MPPRLVDDRDLLDRLTEVFRSVGFDGASLTELSAATGLQRSSLYHRFPGGKAQMAAEVAADLGENSVGTAMAPLVGPGPIEQRIAQIGRTLTAFYEAGAKSCLLETMSIGDVGPAAAAGLAAAAQRWIVAFAAVATEAGASADVATARAQDAIGAIEGALVLARVTGDRRPFERAITNLPGVLLGTARRRQER